MCLCREVNYHRKQTHWAWAAERREKSVRCGRLRNPGSAENLLMADFEQVGTSTGPKAYEDSSQRGTVTKRVWRVESHLSQRFYMQERLEWAAWKWCDVVWPWVLSVIQWAKLLQKFIYSNCWCMTVVCGIRRPVFSTFLNLPLHSICLCSSVFATLDGRSWQVHASYFYRQHLHIFNAVKRIFCI